MKSDHIPGLHIPTQDFVPITLYIEIGHFDKTRPRCRLALSPAFLVTNQRLIPGVPSVRTPYELECADAGVDVVQGHPE